MPGVGVRVPAGDLRLAPAGSAAERAPVGGPAVAPDDLDGVYAAVVGTGPRGISILERLGARLLGRSPARPLTIYAIDADEVGSGRVWRSGQPRWLSMMQVGIGRPGPWGEFFRDADAIAEAALGEIGLTPLPAEEGATLGPQDTDYCFGPQQTVGASLSDH